MINLLAFSIYDSKAEAFITPFFLPTKQMAVRTFADCVNDKNHAFGKHPQDYSLFHVGHFDTQNGQVTPLGRGIECLHVGITLLKTDIPENQLPLDMTQAINVESIRKTSKE